MRSHLSSSPSLAALPRAGRRTWGPIWTLAACLAVNGGLCLVGQQNPTSPPDSAAAPGSVQPQQPNAEQASQVSDAQLLQQVQAALDAEPDLHAAGITASVSQGVVTLNGSVADKQLKQKAEQTVRKIAGVQRVVNHVTVGAGTTTPNPGEAAANPALPGTTVPAAQASATPAGNMASPPAGATSMTPGNAAAGGLDTQVMQTFLSDPELNKYALSATVQGDNVVVLHGTLPTPEAKMRARDAARKIAGIKKVRNAIYVNPTITPLSGQRADMQAMGMSNSSPTNPVAATGQATPPPEQNQPPQSSAANPSATPAANAGAEDPASQVQGQFKNDPALASVMVESTPHGLLLTGTVSNKADKKRAATMARQSAPKLRIKNKITVQAAGMATPAAPNGQGTPPK
ncbi:MAG: BON domain-containing protein [Terriglobales bacterium]